MNVFNLDLNIAVESDSSMKQATYSEGKVKYMKMLSQESIAQMMFLAPQSKRIIRGSQVHAHVNILKIQKISEIRRLTKHKSLNPQRVGVLYMEQSHLHGQRWEFRIQNNAQRMKENDVKMTI